MCRVRKFILGQELEFRTKETPPDVIDRSEYLKESIVFKKQWRVESDDFVRKFT